MQNELLTVQEVATYLRVSRVTVWRWCKRGVIPAFQVGRSWRIRRTDLLNLNKHLGDGEGRINDNDPASSSDKEGLRKNQKILENNKTTEERRKI